MQEDVVETGSGLLGQLCIQADVLRRWIAAAPLATHCLNKKLVDLYTQPRLPVVSQRVDCDPLIV